MTVAATRPTPGTPCWASLMVHDLAASQEFYHQLFGWDYQDGPQELWPYVRALRNGRPVAGLGEMGSQLRRLVAWLPYFATDDTDTTADLIRECGGTVAVGPLDADDMGRLALASDLSGAGFGIWRADHSRNAPFGDVHGAPAWTELITHETAEAAKFYRMVFGYDDQEAPHMPEPGQLALRLADGRAAAGISGVGDAVPPDRGAHWRTYFAVSDPDAAAERTVELGGRRLSEPSEEPFGRFIHVADPHGAEFTLLRPAAERTEA